MIDQLIVILKNHYKRIPVPVLNLLAPLYYFIPASLRYGRIFTDTWEELERQDFLSVEEYEALVDNRFRKIVEHCYYHVPYYRELFAELGLTPADFSSVKDIVKIPVMDKETVRLQGKRMLADTIPTEKLLVKSTSGSTGMPLSLYYEKSTEMREWANVMHIWKRVGYRWDSSRATFRANKSDRNYSGKNHYWDAVRRELRCNIHNMDDQHCEEYACAIERYRPEYIYGYPSSVFQFCRYVSSRKLNHQFKAALLISETVTEEMRAYIEKVLSTRVYSFYGHTERAVMAAECEASDSYHVVPSYGYVELVDEKDCQINDDSVGEIIATGFTNYAMPLLRYRTGDLAQWDCKTECACHRPGPRIKRVFGRTADFFYTKNGDLQNVTSYTYSSYYKYKVQQFQFRQYKPGKVEMYIVVDSTYSSEDAEGLQKLMDMESDNQVEFSIHVCNNIPVGKNGKVRMVIQATEM